MDRKVTERGFSLVQTLVVVAIVVTLSATVLINVLHARTVATVEAAAGEVTALAAAVDAYRLDRGSYPGTIGTHIPIAPQAGNPFLGHVPSYAGEIPVYTLGGFEGTNTSYEVNSELAFDGSAFGSITICETESTPLAGTKYYVAYDPLRGGVCATTQP